jgi:hypothetical protein
MLAHPTGNSQLALPFESFVAIMSLPLISIDIELRDRHTVYMLKTEWNALSKRIVGIVEASTFLFHCRESDDAFSTNVLMETCKEAAAAVKNLSIYRNVMPTRATDALARFEKWWDETVKLNTSGFSGVMAYTTVLASFRSEFDHLFADHDAVIRNTVALAFLHLQRSLVVDQELREKWEAAFAQNEYACEKLGAIHLLSHGIYAFKTDAAGERTDLILGDRLVIDDSIIAGATGLVLTEWKLVRDGDQPEERRIDAKQQANRYSAGSLAGFELSSERYIVLVGRQEFDVVPRDEHGAVLYKTVPIVLNRTVPSKAKSHV